MTMTMGKQATVINVTRLWGDSGWEWTAYGRCADGRSTNGWGSTKQAAIDDLHRQCARLAATPA